MTSLILSLLLCGLWPCVTYSCNVWRHWFLVCYCMGCDHVWRHWFLVRSTWVWSDTRSRGSSPGSTTFDGGTGQMNKRKVLNSFDFYNCKFRFYYCKLRFYYCKLSFCYFKLNFYYCTLSFYYGKRSLDRISLDRISWSKVSNNLGVWPN